MSESASASRNSGRSRGQTGSRKPSGSARHGQCGLVPNSPDGSASVDRIDVSREADGSTMPQPTDSSPAETRPTATAERCGSTFEPSTSDGSTAQSSPRDVDPPGPQSRRRSASPSFVVLVVLGFLIYRGVGISAWWLAVPGLLFAALVLAHEPIRRAGDRSRRSVAVLFERPGTARRPVAGHRLGRAFVSRRRSPVRGRSRPLRHRFALRAAMHRPDTLRRGHAGGVAARSGKPRRRSPIGTRPIRELRPQLDLREDLELLGVEVRQGIDPAALAAWGTATRVFPGRRRSRSSRPSWACSEPRPWWAGFSPTSVFRRLLLVLVVGGIFARLRRRANPDRSRGRRAAHRRPGPALRAAPPSRNAPVSGAALAPARQIARDGGHCRPPSRSVAWLDCSTCSITGGISSSCRFAVLWLWTTQIAIRIDAWRSGPGPRIVHWLRAIGEFEALCALAAYAAENPPDIFPELATGPACFEAQAVGHPLIQTARLRRERRGAGRQYASP